MNDPLDDMLNKLVPVVKPIVELIESKPRITKDSYGDYMAAITRIAEMLGKQDVTLKNKVMLAIGVALQRAGGNKQGITAALRILGAI